MRELKCLLLQKIWQFLACLSLFLCFAQGASAADYSWNYNGSGISSSAAGACEYSVSTGHGWIFVSAVIMPHNPAAAWCYAKTAANPNPQEHSTVVRSGNSCPGDSTYNSTTGACDAPAEDPCKDSTGFKDHQHQIGNLDGTGSRVDPPSSICENSCQYSFTNEAPSSCYRFADGSNKNGAFCKYKYKGNGTSCTTGPNTPPGSLFEQPPAKPPIKPDPSLTKELKCSEWVTNADGTGSRSCTGVTEYKDPGKINCSPGSSGTVVCSPGTPAPDYKKEDVTTTEGKKNNPDGSSQSDTTKTTTTTVCKGAQPCTTTTKTEGDSTGTKPDGTPGDTSSTCEGSGCNPKDEKPKEEEEEEESTVSGDGACPAVPACTGDAIACAILRQTHQQRCNDEEFRKVDEQKISDLKNSLNSEFSGPDYQEIKPTADSTYSLANMIDTSSRFSSSCPSFPIVSYPWITGVTNTLDLNSPGLCVFLSLMGFLNVAFAMRFAAEIIARGLS